MNREEALIQFKQEVVNRFCMDTRKAFYQLFLEKRELFKERLVQGFEKAVRQFWEIGEEESEIAFIQISYLRGSILDGTYQWYIEVQGKDGVLEEADRAVVIQMAEFFTPYEQFEQDLKKEMEHYSGKIAEMDVEKIKREEFDKCRFYLYLGALQAFRGIRKNPYYQKLKKAPLFRILLGEYKGVTQIVHVTDRKRSKEELIAFLMEERKEEGELVCLLEKEELTRRDFEEAVITKGQIVMKNLMYSVMGKSQIEKSFFVCCNLIGVDFEGAELSDSYFQTCTFQNASFVDAKIRMTGFAGSHFELGVWKEGMGEAGLYPVSFRGAVIDGADFSYANLSGCDFRDAQLSGVIWEDTILEGTIFDTRTAEKLKLTEEQRAKIILC